jgi:hypothetical protein
MIDFHTADIRGDSMEPVSKAVRATLRQTGIVLLLSSVSTVFFTAPAAEQVKPAGSFHLSDSHPLGGEGSWDYADYDAIRHRLFVARVGGVLVIDTRTMMPVGSIPALAGTRTHGIALARDLGLGMTSNGDDETSTVFDLTTLAPLRRVVLRHPPDNLIYDPASHAALAFDGDGHTAVAFDPITGKVLAEIDLPGSPEAPASDGQGRVYVNLSDKNEIAVIDTRHWRLEGHWDIGGRCEDPTPLSMDSRSMRLFVGCRSGVLAIVDASAHKLITTLPIGKGTDAIAYEPSSHLIFVSCDDGTLTIASAERDNYRLVQTVSTVPGARTLALDPDGPRVFLPVADLGPSLPKVGDNPSRPAIVPRTFRILTVTR